MNQFPYPYIPNPSMPFFQQQKNLEQEIENLKVEINNLKKRIIKLEQNNQNDYLKKEDGMYML